MLHGLVWMFAFFAVAVAVLWMAGRWTRRDALLSRLPALPARVAWRRLGWVLVTVGSIAFVPLVIERATPLADPVGSGEYLSGSSGWTKSLLIAACGSLLMIFALLRSSGLGASLVALLCLNLGLLALPMLTVREMPWLTSLSLAVVVAALPLMYHLMRRRVELGRAPEILELFARPKWKPNTI